MMAICVVRRTTFGLSTFIRAGKRRPQTEQATKQHIDCEILFKAGSQKMTFEGRVVSGRRLYCFPEICVVVKQRE